MQKLDDTFIELKKSLADGRKLSNRGDDPIYYFIFPPENMLDVKKRLKLWRIQLESKENWTVHILSLAEKIEQFIHTHKRKDVWLEYEKAHPFDYEAVRNTLAAELAKDNRVKNWILEAINDAAREPKGIVFLTDLEAIHPFFRIGTVEQSLQGKCTVPLVIFYPGTRTGRTSLRFLGIYPSDGNYRSVHIGG